MKVDLSELNYKNEIKIDNEFVFDETYSSIKEVKNARFNGRIHINTSNEIILEGILNAHLILYDAVDLSDYDYNVVVNIEENIDLDQKTLDIKEILWENIVLEVPIRVTKHENATQKGEGWEIKDENAMDDDKDPRLAKLQELFKGGE